MRNLYDKCIKDKIESTFLDDCIIRLDIDEIMDQKVSEESLLDLYNKRIFDELWVFYPGYYAMDESTMIGPSPFYINGQVLSSERHKHNVPIMAFPYLKMNVGTMMHILGHRVEGTMTHIFEGWDINGDKIFDMFGYNLGQTENPLILKDLSDNTYKSYGCGSVHFPPNGETDYDYNNKKTIHSFCDYFYEEYPLNLDFFFNRNNNMKIEREKITDINYDTWHKNSKHGELLYMRWWFNHIPKKEGKYDYELLNKEIYNNWWKYVFLLNEDEKLNEKIINSDQAVELQSSSKLNNIKPELIELLNGEIISGTLENLFDGNLNTVLKLNNEREIIFSIKLKNKDFKIIEGYFSDNSMWNVYSSDETNVVSDISKNVIGDYYTFNLLNFDTDELIIKIYPQNNEKTIEIKEIILSTK
ncbi:hypothetical protein HOD20_08820 [archaeon]|jgi:hypothetical protein|nr:hypothetical protein [archaeon]MBT4648242.1 hypothetical protein [archaeon]MBT6820877.1 hypothetical protein [archaeon]MBT7392730.1 hypothetical protein [archaeon]